MLEQKILYVREAKTAFSQPIGHFRRYQTVLLGRLALSAGAAVGKMCFPGKKQRRTPGGVKIDPNIQSFGIPQVVSMPAAGTAGVVKAPPAVTR